MKLAAREKQEQHRTFLLANLKAKDRLELSDVNETAIIP
jgi:hypothetical protein